jgi:transcriptional regulator with GAF, ATPase, and Fis domain
VSPPPESTETSIPPNAGASMRVRLLRVLPVGGARPATLVLDNAPIELGRAGHVTGPLALDDTEVSRVHARIEPDGGGWSIVDAVSRNGTYVDGARVERIPLRDGSVIRIGRTLIIFVDEEVRGGDRLDAPADTRIAGTSLAMLRVHAEIALVAKHVVPVLVLGESGAGKELVAEEIHLRSGRRGAFVPVNCAAISPQLAESELFGHVPGAFTGASRAADGLFVAADGGTLFLDEIGELPAELQPKLLRALATGEVRAVGSSVTRKVDVRVVAATLRDLDGAVEQGTFRGDLYHRLAGWRISVPPLRARRDDIIAIAAEFLARKQAPPLTADAAEALALHDWPGNVRELDHVLAAAIVRADPSSPSAEIRLEHLPPAFAHRLAHRTAVPATASVNMPLPIVAPREVAPTRDELCAALERYGGNVARVAEHYARDRQQVYRWARRYGVDLDAYRRE